MISRDSALALIQSHNPEPHMIQHALASEAVMHALAEHFGEDAELWARTGLLHDVDYPLTKENPEQHGLQAETMLLDHLPQQGVAAVKAHNSECTGVEPATRLDFALRAAETVTGLISAAALVRPTGLEGMQASSLKKKMKDKAFAASVSRERIKECERIDLPLDQFLTLSIAAMAKQ